MSIPSLTRFTILGLLGTSPLLVGGCGRSSADPAVALAPSSPDAAVPRPVAPAPTAAPSAPAADLGGKKPGAHTDHAARHGGMLLMNGDLHFEVVFDPAGRHRVHFSDAVRAPLPASVAAEVTLTINRKGAVPEPLVLARAEDGASWVSSGKPLEFGADDVARIAYTRANAKPYWIDVPITRPGPQAPAAAGAGRPGKPKPKHDHTHGAHD